MGKSLGRMSRKKGKSRRKGKVGELEVAGLIREEWKIGAKRGVQHKGGPDSPDVEAKIPGVHIEVKRDERTTPWSALEQAEAEKPPSSIPVAFLRRNRKRWIVALFADEVPAFAKRLLAARDRADNTAWLRDLVGMDWAKAKKLKNEVGRAHYGEGWVGAHPLLEGHADLVDVGVYLERADRMLADEGHHSGTIHRLCLRAVMDQVAEARARLVGHIEAEARRAGGSL